MDENKVCTGCEKSLPLSDFHFVPSRKRHRPKCKECEKIQRRKYIKPHEDARRRHGFTDEQYEEIVSKADDGCEICGKSMKKKICFDHDHQTGKFRGLLCHNCNTMLGLSLDNISTLEKAIHYLQNHSNS